MNETFIPASDYSRKKWYVIDCKGKQLGRISSSIVGLLSGKIKSYYHPAFDTGDYVILINAESLTVDRNSSSLKILLVSYLGIYPLQLFFLNFKKLYSQ